MIDVIASNEQDEISVDLERWQQLAASVLADLIDHEPAVPIELTLTFVDEAEMTALNAQQMGIDAPTDVLAFPLDMPTGDGIGGAGVDPGGPPLLLGDVVICPSVAARAASTHAGTYEDELALLVVHGMLHLFGHDHAEPEQAAVMRASEQALLERWHWRGVAPPGFSFEHRDQ